jgi:hypothetical protein
VGRARRLYSIRDRSPGSGPSPKTTHPVHLKGAKVYTGTPMKCSFGTAKSSIKLYSGKPAIVSDCKAYMHIPSFGQCKAPQRPGTPIVYGNKAMDVMFVSPETELPVCTPVIVAPWSGSFESGVPNDFSQVIDKTATCLCMWGGTIRFA